MLTPSPAISKAYNDKDLLFTHATYSVGLTRIPLNIPWDPGGGRCLCKEQLLGLSAKTESGTLLADFPQEGKGTGKFIHCSQVFFLDKTPISLAR